MEAASKSLYLTYICVILAVSFGISVCAVPGRNERSAQFTETMILGQRKPMVFDFRLFEQKPLTVTFPPDIVEQLKINSMGQEKVKLRIYPHPKPPSHLPMLPKKSFEEVKKLYTLIPGHGYYRAIKRYLRDWYNAEHICSSEGTHLVVINSKDEAEALTQLYFSEGIKSDLTWHKFLVGLKTANENEPFKTVLGTPVEISGFNDWNDEEEYDFSDMEVCAIYDMDLKKLRKWACTGESTYICEHE